MSLLTLMLQVFISSTKEKKIKLFAGGKNLTILQTNSYLMELNKSKIT